MKQNPSNSNFTEFSEFQAYLDELGLFHMDLGLSRVEGVLSRLDVTRPAPLCVQILGTNGKGSTSTMLASLLREQGLATGLFLSPHFLSVKERILVNGAQLSDEDWVQAANAVIGASDPDPANCLTYFELLTAMAAWLFSRRKVAAAVFEAGLGGAHDATTALDRDLTLFTPIGEDHLKELGPTLQDVARDKAGAMRPGIPALTGQQPPEVMAALREAAEAKNLLLPAAYVLDFAPEIGLLRPKNGMPGPIVEDIIPCLSGLFQTQNAHLALAAYYFLAQRENWAIDPATARNGMCQAFIPGRMQRVRLSGIKPLFILDGAHNVPAMKALKEALDQELIAPSTLVFNCLRDKNLADMAPRVTALTHGRILVPEIPDCPRALPAAETAAALGRRAIPVADMAEALSRAAKERGPILVCGSFYLLAQFFRLRPEALVQEPAACE